MTAATVKGLEALQRRLAAATAPQPIKAVLRAEAEAIAAEPAVRLRRAWANGRSDRRQPRHEACLRHRHP